MTDINSFFSANQDRQMIEDKRRLEEERLKFIQQERKLWYSPFYTSICFMVLRTFVGIWRK